MEEMERRRRRRTQLIDDLKEMSGYCKLREEALDRTLQVNRFGNCSGPVVRQTAECSFCTGEGAKAAIVNTGLLLGRNLCFENSYELAQVPYVEKKVKN